MKNRTNWQDIKVSEDHTYFLFVGQPLFGKKFIEVLKFHAPGLAPVRNESGWYHIDTNGKPLYSQKYSRAFGFYCERASIVSDKDCFHIDSFGNRLYPDSYAWTGNFQEDLCVVRNKVNQYFHINLYGVRVYESSYLYAGDFKDGFACVRLQTGRYKHIDSKGNYVNDKEFLDLGGFHKNIATAKDERGWFHIDKNGNELYTQRYLAVEPYYNGYAVATKWNSVKSLVDEHGGEVHLI